MLGRITEGNSILNEPTVFGQNISHSHDGSSDVYIRKRILDPHQLSHVAPDGGPALTSIQIDHGYPRPGSHQQWPMFIGEWLFQITAVESNLSWRILQSCLHLFRRQTHPLPTLVYAESLAAQLCQRRLVGPNQAHLIKNF
jgi:hypothetical protein